MNEKNNQNLNLKIEMKPYNNKKTASMKTCVVIVCIIIVYGCQSNNTVTINNSDPLNTDSVQLTETAIIDSVNRDSVYQDTSVYISYFFPTPDEIMEEIINAKMEFDLSIVNPIKNAGKYVSTKQQALNLGVYLSDLAYINLTADKNDAIQYFKVVRELALKLNVFTVFDENMYDRIQNNLSNKDSLNQILKTMYNDILDLLESTDRNNIYALITSGALIEALYISSMNIKDFEKFKPIAIKIFEQKYVINNFYEFASQYKNDRNVKEVLLLIDNFKAILENEVSATSEKSVTQVKKDNFVLSGGENIVISEKQFNRFKDSVASIRNKIIK